MQHFTAGKISKIEHANPLKFVSTLNLAGKKLLSFAEKWQFCPKLNSLLHFFSTGMDLPARGLFIVNVQF